jgi:RNA polymerase sigma-70 factor (ECF subfamily)
MPVAARSEEPLDEVTLRRAQRGDERAWRDLIARYERPIHALIWRMLVSRRERVEDLVQETFVRVLHALPTFDPGGAASLSTWMLTIATRLTLNELRRKPLIANPFVEYADSAEVDVSRRQLGAAIAAAVAKLPPDQRAVLVLREYHDLDYSEIAVVLELELGTVKSRMSRARATLRDHLITAMPELGERHGR